MRPLSVDTFESNPLFPLASDCRLDLRLGGSFSPLDPLGDEETKDTNTDCRCIIRTNCFSYGCVYEWRRLTDEDDAEDDNDTGLSSSEVLSLHELGGNIPGGNELLVDGGHCV